MSSAQVTGTARTTLAIVEDIRSHRTLVDLGADDFIVQEGNEPREILSVRPADYPVVVMIDTGVSEADLPLVQKAARRFVERLGSGRPVALGTYGTYGGPARMIAGFDADRVESLQKLDALSEATSSGSIQQAAGRAAEALASTGAMFSSIVVLSGDHHDEPASSEHTERFDATPSVIASGAMLYVVAMRPPANQPRQSNEVELLRTVAEQTRGQFISIYNAASFDAALDQISRRMASELMIEYLVPNHSKAADVQLGVRVPGARVRGLGVR
ncbi:MAG TPA: hypothetical protein VFP91_09070 [Vicinamibacterales bacterium]|nr:hypothetical protein [Vicinamibacterales bacterium]